MNRLAGNRIDAGAYDRKSLLVVETQRAGIVGVDVELKPRGRERFGDGDQRRADARSPMLRRDHDLVQITAARVDGDKADDFVGRLRDHVVGLRTPW